jgi:hypothetical protein
LLRVLVARGATVAATLLLEAVAAIDGAVATGLERHFCGTSATGTNGVKHLPLAALVRTTAATTAAVAATVRCFALCAAFWAARGRVVQSAARVKFLLTGGEHEVLPAIAAA